MQFIREPEADLAAEPVEQFRVWFDDATARGVLQPEAMTIATATLFSLFIGFTLTPMLASRWLKDHDPDHHDTGAWARFVERWEGWIDKLQNPDVAPAGGQRG